MLALKCETDFVANGADFIALTQSILDAAIAAKATDLEAVKNLTVNGQTAQEAVTQRSGITGEKMELDGYLTTTWASTLCAPWYRPTSPLLSRVTS